jgi:putative membrane protein
MTNSFSIETVEESRGPGIALWALLLLFAAGNILPVFPRAFSPVLYAAGQILPATIFALVHCARVYRLRGAVVFTLSSLFIGYLMELIGVHTGFPFGHYYFTDGMGPKLFAVPILMGPAYVGMGYVSWTIARIIVSHENDDGVAAGARLVALPLVASFAMVAWDISFDPALSTFGHYWVWLEGGSYFGVPVSNFLGWLLTNYLIFQLFALYVRRGFVFSGKMAGPEAPLAVIFYAVCATGCILRAASTSFKPVVTDPAGTLWRVRDINNVCALAAILCMGPFVLLAATNLIVRTREPVLPAAMPDRRSQSPDSLVRSNELLRVP